MAPGSRPRGGQLRRTQIFGIHPPHNAFLRKLLAGLFPEEEVALVEGEADTAQALLALPFDHIFFTGAPAVGKSVMKAAAEHYDRLDAEALLT